MHKWFKLPYLLLKWHVQQWNLQYKTISLLPWDSFFLLTSYDLKTSEVFDIGYFKCTNYFLALTVVFWNLNHDTKAYYILCICSSNKILVHFIHSICLTFSNSSFFLKWWSIGFVRHLVQMFLERGVCFTAIR